MSQSSVAMRMCCDCSDILEEKQMYRCASCEKFMCADCHCKCAEPERESASETSGEASTFAGRAAMRMGAVIAKLFR
jgi:hypothetical protein